MENPNRLGSRCYIEELIVHQGKKIGNGSAFNVHFSPWLNTIIGGRGSGKTTIIEFLRIILDKKKNLPKEIELVFGRFAKVASGREEVGMLRKDTKIEVIIFKDGRRLKLSWVDGIWEEYYQENGVWKLNSGTGDISQRFPVQIYSQKQLYEMAEDLNCLIDYIDSLRDHQAWLQQLDDLSKDYKLACRQERDLRNKLGSKSTLQAQLSDLNAKINMLESAANDPVFTDIKEFASQSIKLETELRQILEKTSELQGLSIQTFAIKDTNAYNVLDDEYTKKYQELIQEWSDAKKDYDALQFRLEAIGRCAEEIQREYTKHLSPEYEKTKARYSQAVDELQRKGFNGIDVLELLYTKRTSLVTSINEMDDLQKQLESILTSKQDLFERIMKQQKTLRDERNQIIEKLNSSQIKITLLPMQDTARAEMEFRNIIRKDNQYQSDIYDPEHPDTSIIGRICNLDQNTSGLDIWKNRTSIITELFTSDNTENYGKRFRDYMLSLLRDRPEDIDELSIWVPPDAIKLEIYMNGRFTNIAQGSAGQKTMALLSMILGNDNGPLIIDQPEDDLDTKLITDMLVNRLRSQKASNQVIVVTHNPNIPVNGAAEQIIAMHFAKGQIVCKVEGALQKDSIRNEICDVMEGGRDALRKRYYRIYKPLSR